MEANHIPPIAPLETPPDFKIPEERKAFVLFYLHKIRIRALFYWRKLVPPSSKEHQADIQIQLREASQPDFDYFVLVVLSCMIATFGLLIDSAATIIGAMLVAPLMSPILGLGLSSIRGDTKLLQNSITALIRGAIIAIVISALITWLNDILPFVTLQDLPNEVLSRTRPSPIDLGVALAGGLAATFALVQPQLSAAMPGVAIATALMPPLCVIGVGIALGDYKVASGALLLFITNGVTIAAAAIGLFYALGFSPPKIKESGKIPKSLKYSIILTLLLLAPLGWQSYQFVQQATFTRELEKATNDNVEKMGGELDGMEWVFEDNLYKIDIRILVPGELNYAESVELQEGMKTDLQKDIQLKINQVVQIKLDPAILPTTTAKATLGPSPTYTNTVIPPTATKTPTSTPTLTPTNTPTATPTNTPTPSTAELTITGGASLKAFADGPTIGYLAEGDVVTVLYGYEIVDGWVWIEVLDSEGKLGWIPQFYTTVLLPTTTP
jgi:uncharacterized hydrophobic protein (TIGR00271 family)